MFAFSMRAPPAPTLRDESRQMALRAIAGEDRAWW